MGAGVSFSARGGLTLLAWAAKGGHEGVVKILLERDDVNPNIPDRYGETPLVIAARKGHEGVVKMLLERNDVNLNTRDRYGKPQLYRAACEGHEGVVKMLLCVNKNNRTPTIGGNATLLITPHFEHHIKKFFYINQNPTTFPNSFYLRNYASYSSQSCQKTNSYPAPLGVYQGENPQVTRASNELLPNFSPSWHPPQHC